MSVVVARLARPLGVVFIVALAVFVALSVAGMALLLVVLPAHSTTSGGLSPVPFAVPGVAFQPAAVPPDRTGWRAGYVIANRTATYVLSARPGVLGGATAGDEQHNRLVALSDVAGHPYDERPDATFGALPDATGRFYDVTIFPPLRAGTTVVLVHHNSAGGGTVRVGVDVARAAAAPLPLATSLVAMSGRAKLTVATVTRGGLLSQLDLEERGLATGRQATQGGGETVATIPSWAPSTVTMRTATGTDLAPIIGEGPVQDGVSTATIGFRTPPRGSLVTLVVDDKAPSRSRLHAPSTHSWRVNFRMP